jgi:hypothetical protein
MIEVKISDDLMKEIEKGGITKQKEVPNSQKQENIGFNDINQNDIINKKSTDDIINDNKQNNNNNNNINDKQKLNINNSKINKAKTFETGKRKDRYGNMIIHGGKQKVTFIDRVSKNNFTEVVKVENYKEYNKMEEITGSGNRGNICCCFLL